MASQRALSLAALILWFGCYSEVMTSEKFLYLFGKIAPASALAYQHGTAAGAEAQPSAYGDQGESGDAPPGKEESRRQARNGHPAYLHTGGLEPGGGGGADGFHESERLWPEAADNLSSVPF